MRTDTRPLRSRSCRRTHGFTPMPFSSSHLTVPAAAALILFAVVVPRRPLDRRLALKVLLRLAAIQA